MKWSAMTPEQRNALVAEQIGWTPEPCPGRFSPADYVGSGQQLCISCGAKYAYPGPMVHNSLPPPHYGESMDAAWQIVEHFRGRRFDVHVGSAPLQYDAAILDRRMGGKSFAASAASAPEAICKAALKAYGVEIEIEP